MNNKIDISTTYLGLNLKSPIVPSAGPLSKEVYNIKAMEDAGAGAVVLFSLFEEEIENDAEFLHHHIEFHSDSFAEATTMYPPGFEYKIGPDEYLNHIAKAKSVVDIPVIASLNGRSTGGWIEYAKKIEQAGADALELNIYLLATNLYKSSAELENEYLDIIKEVKMNVNIPVSVKLHPFFTSVARVAHELDLFGINGIVMFNRFYQPDIDLENLEVVPNVLLSTPMAMRLPLRWTAILYGRIQADIAVTSGVHTEKDVIKMVMAGAKVTQMLSCLLKFGITHISETINKLVYWMDLNEYASLEQMRGSMSYLNIDNPSLYERANYMKVIHSYK